MLRFPAESANPSAPVRFQHGNNDCVPPHFDRLIVTDAHQGVVRNGFNEAITERCG
jgi:hypothetical protein